MTLVLDSSVIFPLEKSDKVVREKLRDVEQKYVGPPSITFITYFEFLFGITDRNFKNREKAVAFIDKFDILPVTKRTAKILSDLKYTYEKSGISLSLSDMMIASQVIEKGMILVTCDKDFAKINEVKTIFI